MPFLQSGSSGSGSAGFEVGYDQVTASVTVSSATEASGTTVITCAPHTFDGAAVLAQFFCPRVQVASSDQILVSLFEGATQITRLGLFTAGGAVNPTFAATLSYRFTPTAASHTYTVTATKSTTNGTLACGSGGTAGDPPMFIRFTKV